MLFLKKIVSETSSRLKTLKTLSTTRWACRAEAVTAVEKNFSSVIQTLEEISKNTKYSEVRTKANGLIYQIKNFNFIFALYMLKPILIQIQIVSAQLQAANLNLLDAVSIVNALKKSISELRNDESNYSKLYDKVLTVCNEFDIDIPCVKNRKVSTKIDDIKTQHTITDKKSEMKCHVFFTVLDDLYNGLENRFNQETLSVISAIGRLI